MKTMNTNKTALATRIATVTRIFFLLYTCLSSLYWSQAYSSTIERKPREVHQSLSIKLENYEGFYQLPNKVAFIAFTLKDGALFAKQLWDNKEYQLIQINETNFESKEEGHTVEFQKDASGQVNSAKILGRIIITKVEFNPNNIKKLPTANLKKLNGTYALKDDHSFKIEIQSSPEGLTLKQLWDKKEVEFTPRSETFFLSGDGTFPLTFVLNGEKVVQVTCFEHDVWRKLE